MTSCGRSQRNSAKDHEIDSPRLVLQIAYNLPLRLQPLCLSGRLEDGTSQSRVHSSQVRHPGRGKMEFGSFTVENDRSNGWQKTLTGPSQVRSSRKVLVFFSESVGFIPKWCIEPTIAMASFYVSVRSCSSARIWKTLRQHERCHFWETTYSSSICGCLSQKIQVKLACDDCVLTDLWILTLGRPRSRKMKVFDPVIIKRSPSQ